MPDGLAAAMTADDRRDLIRFLLDLGRPGGNAAGHLARHGHVRGRVFRTFATRSIPNNGQAGSCRSTATAFMTSIAKEAEYFSKQPSIPPLLPQFPGLDGGRHGPLGQPE